MSTLTKLRNRAQVTLPKEVVKALDLKVGDDLKVDVESGHVVITPVAIVPKDELWALRPEIREAIIEGRKETRTGKLKSHDNLDKMFAEWDGEGAAPMNNGFPSRLQYIRTKNGLTLEELGEATGHAKSSLSKYENGVHAPNVTILIELANYFKVSSDWLLGLKDIDDL